MKRQNRIAALVLVVALCAFPVLADRGVVTIFNAVVVTGASATRVFAEQDQAGATYVFQFHATGSGAAKIECSIDRANWVTAYTFTGTDDIKALPVCGGCAFRGNATTASAGNTVTVKATLSGYSRLLQM